MSDDYSISEMVGRLDRRFGSHVRHQQLRKLVVELSLGLQRSGRWRIPASNEDRIAERLGLLDRRPAA